MTKFWNVSKIFFNIFVILCNNLFSEEVLQKKSHFISLKLALCNYCEKKRVASRLFSLRKDMNFKFNQTKSKRYMLNGKGWKI